MNYSIIIPIFNEEKNIPLVIKKLVTYLGIKN